MRLMPLPIAALLICGCAQIPPSYVQLPTKYQNLAVITDIDGTLTPKNIDVGTARPKAADALSTLAKKGYKIVYITTRIPLFQSGLPDWLKQNGFPPGSLHVAQTASERNYPEMYKANILAAYAVAGWHFAYAYGDSSTDFAAYADAKIPKDRVFALKRKGDSECQGGVYERCLEGWEDHLRDIEKNVPSVP